MDKLIKDEPDSNQIAERLICAFKLNSPDLARSIILNNAIDINSVYVYSILDMAVIYDSSIEMIDLLLSLGADPNIRSSNGIPPLLTSVTSKNIPIIKRLIEAKADSNIEFKNTTPLLHAINEENLDLVNCLIEGKADINQDNIMISPLGLAASGCLPIFERLISAGADINFESDISSVLGYACYSGNLEMVQRLIELKVIINPKNNATGFHSPLWTACTRRYLNIAKILIESGADVNRIEYGDNGIGSNLLFLLSYDGNDGDIEMIKLLIQYKSDVNFIVKDATNQTLMSPLASTCVSGNIQIFYELMNSGSDLDYESTIKGLPYSNLSLSIKYNRVQMVEILLTLRDWDLNQVDDSGFSSIFYTIKNKSIECFDLLTSKPEKINLNLKNLEGQTPLIYAIYMNQVEIAQKLIDLKSDVHGIDKSGWSTLCYAIKVESEEICRSLLFECVDINLVTKDKLTPLILACQNNFTKMIQFLIKNCDNVSRGFFEICESGQDEYLSLFLERKFPINLTDKRGRTGLYLAAENNHSDIVKILLENKADPEIETSRGLSPLKIAINNEHIESVKLLLQYGAGISKIKVSNIENEELKYLVRNYIRFVTKIQNKNLITKDFLDHINKFLEKLDFLIESTFKNIGIDLKSNLNILISYHSVYKKFYYRKGKQKSEIDDVYDRFRKGIVKRLTSNSQNVKRQIQYLDLFLTIYKELELFEFIPVSDKKKLLVYHNPFEDLLNLYFEYKGWVIFDQYSKFITMESKLISYLS